MYWHVLWTVYPIPVPNRQRNSIERLYELYEALKIDKIEHEVSQALKVTAQSSNIQPGRLIINPRSIEEDISSLTNYNSDRIAGNLPIIGISVTTDRVELLAEFDGDNLLQKIARLKSRSATLLSFRSERGGKHTWSKGIWYARSTDKRFMQYVRERIIKLKNS